MPPQRPARGLWVHRRGTLIYIGGGGGKVGSREGFPDEVMDSTPTFLGTIYGEEGELKCGLTYLSTFSLIPSRGLTYFFFFNEHRLCARKWNAMNKLRIPSKHTVYCLISFHLHKQSAGLPATVYPTSPASVNNHKTGTDL